MACATKKGFEAVEDVQRQGAEASAAGSAWQRGSKRIGTLAETRKCEVEETKTCAGCRRPRPVWACPSCPAAGSSTGGIGELCSDF